MNDDVNGPDGIDPEEMQRIEREVIEFAAAKFATITPETIAMKMAQYEQVKGWPIEAQMANLFIEAVHLSDKEIFKGIGSVDDGTVKAYIVPEADGLVITGEIAMNNKRFIAPFSYTSGRLVIDETQTKTRSNDAPEDEPAQPMSEIDRRLISPAVSRILEGAALLLHEAVKRQLREFEAVRALAGSVDRNEAARANALVKIAAEPQTRKIHGENGEVMTFVYSLKNNQLEGKVTYDGDEFFVEGNEMAIVGTEDKIVRIAVGAPETIPQEKSVAVHEAVTEFIQPRWEDYHHAYGLASCGMAAEKLRHADCGLHVLEGELRLEEGKLAQTTRAIRERRLDLDGLQVEAKLTRVR